VVPARGQDCEPGNGRSGDYHPVNRAQRGFARDGSGQPLTASFISLASSSVVASTTCFTVFDA
jgi:hypothetical protein